MRLFGGYEAKYERFWNGILRFLLREKAFLSIYAKNIFT